ncbi:hypothetical protein [Streptomyces sp. NPDC054783]
MSVNAGMLTWVEGNGADGWASVHDALRQVLSQPVSRLVTAESSIAVGVAERWDLPEGDRAALYQWGLPRNPLFTPCQADTLPTLLPNRAGGHERRLVMDGQRLYDLGY